MPTQTTEPPGTITARLLPVLIALSLACAFGIFTFAAAIGFTGSKLVAVIVAVGIAALVAWFFWRRPIVPLDEGANSRALNVISGLATIAALFQLARLCVFIVTRIRLRHWSFARARTPVSHSCLSAYYVAAGSVATVPNVCLGTVFLPGQSTVPRKRMPIGSFNIDAYSIRHRSFCFRALGIPDAGVSSLPYGLVCAEWRGAGHWAAIVPGCWGRWQPCVVVLPLVWRPI